MKYENNCIEVNRPEERREKGRTLGGSGGALGNFREPLDQLELRESCGSVAGVELLRGRYFATQAPALVIHIVFSLGLGRTHDGHPTPPGDCAKTLIWSVAGTNGRLKVDDSIALLKKTVAGCSVSF